MDQASSQDRVFALPETTEAIFLLLSPRDLLVNVQRVNQAWHNTIKSSIFQRLLFFEAWPQDLSRDPEFSPLLVKAFPNFFTHTTEHDHYGSWPQESLARTDWASSDARIDAYQRKEASWRLMLVVQPPVKRMDIIKTNGWQTAATMTEGQFLDHEGLKMGVLYDFVEEEAHSGDDFDSMSFDIEWHMFAAPDVEPRAASGMNEKNKVMVRVSHGSGCCPVERDDYLLPVHLRGKDFSDYTDQDREDFGNAVNDWARPHLRSHAFSTVPVEWGEEKITWEEYQEILMPGLYE